MCPRKCDRKNIYYYGYVSGNLINTNCLKQYNINYYNIVPTTSLTNDIFLCIDSY